MAKKTAPPSLPPARAAKSRADVPAQFTDTRRVKELIALMTDNGLTEIELVEDKSRIVLRRGTVSGGSVPAAVTHAPTHAAAAHHAPGAPATGPTAVEDEFFEIKSPMVGTFYSAPNPESDNYVSVGSQVDEKTVVCIIEAMKVFNEIHAEIRGSIVRILVSNGQVVEFGQPLFLVKPA